MNQITNPPQSGEDTHGDSGENLVESAYTVEYTVRGAYTIKHKRFDSLSDAARFAARWRRSNSTGHYQAWIYDPAGKELSA